MMTILPLLFVLSICIPICIQGLSWPRKGGNSLQNHFIPSGDDLSQFKLPYRNNDDDTSNSPSSPLFNFSFPSSSSASPSNIYPCGNLLVSYISQQWQMPSGSSYYSKFFMGTDYQGNLQFNYTVNGSNFSNASPTGDMICDDNNMLYITLQGIQSNHYLLGVAGVKVSTPEKNEDGTYQSVIPQPLPVVWQLSTPTQNPYGVSPPQLLRKNYLIMVSNITLLLIDTSTGDIVSSLSTATLPGINSYSSIPVFSSFNWMNSEIVDIFASVSITLNIPLVIHSQLNLAKSPPTFSPIILTSLNSYVPNPPPDSNAYSWYVQSFLGDESDPNQSVYMVASVIGLTPMGYSTLAVFSLSPQNRSLVEFIWTPTDPAYPFQNTVASMRHPFLFSNPSTHVPSAIVFMESMIAPYIDNCETPYNISKLAMVAVDITQSPPVEIWRIPLPSYYSECGYAVLVYNLMQCSAWHICARWGSLFSGPNLPIYGAKYWVIDKDTGDYTEGVYVQGWSYASDGPIFIEQPNTQGTVSISLENVGNGGYGYREIGYLTAYKWLWQQI